MPADRATSSIEVLRNPWRPNTSRATARTRSRRAPSPIDRLDVIDMIYIIRNIVNLASADGSSARSPRGPGPPGVRDRRGRRDRGGHAQAVTLEPGGKSANVRIAGGRRRGSRLSRRYQLAGE